MPPNLITRVSFLHDGIPWIAQLYSYYLPVTARNVYMFCLETLGVGGQSPEEFIFFKGSTPKPLFQALLKRKTLTQTQRLELILFNRESYSVVMSYLNG